MTTDTGYPKSLDYEVLAESPEVEEDLETLIREALRQHNLPEDAIRVEAHATTPFPDAAMIVMLQFTIHAAWTLWDTVILPSIQRKLGLKPVKSTRSREPKVAAISENTEMQDDTDEETA